jgi:hypothetical protein
MVGDYIVGRSAFADLAIGVGPTGFWGVNTTADVIPEPSPYPPGPIGPGQAPVPVSYLIDPYLLENPPYEDPPGTRQDDVTIVPQPETLRVDLVAERNLAAPATLPGKSERISYHLSSVANAADLGPREFLADYIPVVLAGGSIYPQLRISFNPDNPPSPEMFGTPAEYDNIFLEMQYLARRNFDPDTGRDDRILVSFSTRQVYDVALGLDEFFLYDPIATGSPYLRPSEQGAEASLKERVTVPHLASQAGGA